LTASSGARCNLEYFCASLLKETALNGNFSFPLRPQTFASRVLRAVKQELLAFSLTFTVLLAAGVVVTRLIPPLYESTASLLLEYPRSTEQLIDNNTELSRLQTVGERTSPVNNQVVILLSSNLYSRALKQLHMENDPPKGKLSVKAVGGTDLIDVSYRTNSPKLAQRVVQALIDVYTTENLSDNRQKGSSARIFIEKQLPALWQRLQKAQNNLSQFQRNNHFLGIAAETEATSHAQAELSSDINRAQAEMAFTERKIASLRTRMPGNLHDAVSSAGLSQESGYQLLQNQLLQAETQLAELSSRFGSQNPQVLNANQKIEKLKQLLAGRSQELTGSASSTTAEPAMDPLRQRLVEQWVGLEAEHAAQVARLTQLKIQLKEIQSRAFQLPTLNKQQAQLQMVADTARQDYLDFKQKYTTSRIAEQQNISNVRLIEPPTVSWESVYPNRKLLFALTLVGSISTGLFVVWLRSNRSDEIDGLVTLGELLPLPILVTVPWLGNGRLSLQERIDQRPLANSYLLLQAYLRILPKKMRAIAICSWSTQEGCSSVAANLGLLESKAGRRVLLIDADGRFPGQPEFWNFQRVVQNSQSGENLDWQKLIYKAQPDLDILSLSGKNPSEAYGEWLSILEQVRNSYDLILVDCPPMMHGPDATLLASITDGVLWVTCPRRLGKQQAIACAEKLRIWANRLLGQIVIGADDSLPGLQPARDLSWLPESPKPARRWLPGTSKEEKA
jgi:polysaccharide biosynthesis transport protein